MPKRHTTPKHGDDDGNTADAEQHPALAASITPTARSDDARLARHNLHSAAGGLGARLRHSVRHRPPSDLAIQLGFRRYIRFVRAEHRMESRQPSVRFAG